MRAELMVDLTSIPTVLLHDELQRLARPTTAVSTGRLLRLKVARDIPSVFWGSVRSEVSR